MQSVHLPENHRRSLSVTAHMIERSLDEMENLLRSAGGGTLTSSIERTYSDEKRQRLLAAIERMKEANAEMVRALNLVPNHYTEEQIIKARNTHLWTLLVDSKPEAMKGFGEMPRDVAAVVDSHVNKLLQLLEQLS